MYVPVAVSKTLLFVVIVTGALVVSGCDKVKGIFHIPTAPTVDRYPEQKPISLPQVILDTGSGAFTINFISSSFQPGSEVKVTQGLSLLTNITNSSPRFCNLWDGVSNGPSDHPGEKGRSTVDGAVFGSTIRSFVPNEVKPNIYLGFTVSAPDEVPYIRFFLVCGETKTAVDFYNSDQYKDKVSIDTADVEVNFHLVP